MISKRSMTTLGTALALSGAMVLPAAQAQAQVPSPATSAWSVTHIDNDGWRFTGEATDRNRRAARQEARWEAFQEARRARFDRDECTVVRIREVRTERRDRTVWRATVVLRCERERGRR